MLVSSPKKHLKPLFLYSGVTIHSMLLLSALRSFGLTNIPLKWFHDLSLEPPSFTKVPEPIEGLKGKDVSLYCELTGTAPFQITWFKDKKPLMESRKYKMLTEGSSVTLHVIGLESTDVGQYECKASNSVGSDTCQTLVKLRGQ